MKRKSFIMSFALFVLIAVMALAGCNGNTGGNIPPTTQEDMSPADTPPLSSDESVKDIGHGETVFRFEVTDDNETVTAWNVHTDETTIGAALLTVGLVDGNTSEFGLMVTKVNGLEADYDADKSWWAFYVDGDMAMTGVDSTDIEAGKTYSFVYTKD